MEAVISGIWCNVLGIEGVGADDDFFALGGQSLAVMRVLSRVRDVCGVELPVRSFFANPTVAELAAVVEDVLSTIAGGDSASPGMADARSFRADTAPIPRLKRDEG
jgi:acyl carrier protein